MTLELASLPSSVSVKTTFEMSNLENFDNCSGFSAIFTKVTMIELIAN